MIIRFAGKQDIPGMIDLLRQVGEVHHQIRPDLFRSGAQKYNEADLEELLKDPSRPVLIAEEEGTVAGYAFCIVQVTENNPVLCDRKVLYQPQPVFSERPLIHARHAFGTVAAVKVDPPMRTNLADDIAAPGQNDTAIALAHPP